MKYLRNTSLILAILTLSACADGGGDSDTTPFSLPDPVVFAPPDEATLVVVDAPVSEQAVGGVIAYFDEIAPGTRFLRIDLVLANGVGAPPLPLGHRYFDVTNDVGEIIEAAAISKKIPGSCDDELDLAPGFSRRCQVVFSIPEDATIRTLTYRGPREASATVMVRDCTDCGVCVDLATDPFDCGSCDQRVSTEDNSNDHTTYLGHLGRCEAGTVRCDEGPTIALCGGDGCVDLSEDDRHCGACGSTCLQGACAPDGQCTDYFDENVRDSCVRICGRMNGMCKGETVAWYSDGWRNERHTFECREVPDAVEPNGAKAWVETRCVCVWAPVPGG